MEDDTRAPGGLRRHTSYLPAHHCKQLKEGCKGTFHNSSYASIRYVSGAAAASVLQLRKEGKGKRREKKLRTADLVLHAIPKGPSEEGVRGEKKGEGKGCGEKTGKSTHPLSVARESPKG